MHRGATSPLRPKLENLTSVEYTVGEGVVGCAPRILRLAGGQYEDVDRSGVLPSLTKSVLSEFCEQNKTLTTLAWRRMVRTWARAQAR